ncbi:MAG TPA: hypothetical protein VGN34_33700, partial [Ktedonobacteraceae bacterium]
FVGMALHHLYTSPQPLYEKVPSLPYEINEVVLRTLAKQSGERFPTVTAFAKALEEAYKTTLSHGGVAYSSTSLPPVSSTLPLPTTFPSLQIDPSAQTVRMEVDPSAPTFMESLGATTELRQGSISRRTVATALTGLVGLSAISGGVIWYTLTHAYVPSSPAPRPIATAQSLTLPVRPVGTTLATYSGHTDSVTDVTLRTP